MKRVAAIFATTLLALVAGCGGSGSDSSSDRPEPTATISGHVFVGDFNDASVYIYAWDGSKGERLGLGNLDDQGRYSIELDQALTSQPVIIEVDGAYNELANNDFVVMSYYEPIRALHNFTAGEVNQVMVNPFTTIASGLARWKTGLGLPSDLAIDQANTEVSAWVGFSVSDRSPINVSTEMAGEVTAGVKAGFMAGAVSQLTDALNVRSLDFIESAVADVSADGRLDGQGPSGSLSLGNSTITQDLYRYELAANLLVFANSDSNNSNLKAVDLFGLATTVNGSDGVIFNESEPLVLDGSGPIFCNLNFKVGQTVAGVVELSASIVDLAGLDDVSLYVDGSLHEFAGSSSNPVFTVDTTAFSDGPLAASIRAKNVNGVTVEKDAGFVVNNGQPTITNFLPADGALIGGSQTFSASVSAPAGVQSARFLLDGSIPYYPNSFSNPTITIDTTTIPQQAEQHSMTLRVTSQTNATTSETVTFTLDNVDPTASWNLSSVSVISGDYEVSGQIADNQSGVTGRLLIDGNVISTFQEGSFSQIIPTNTYADGNYQVTLEVVDQTGNAVIFSRELIFDNTPPKVTLSNPWEGDVITTSFNIVALIEDAGGVDESVIYLVDGVEYSTDRPAPRVSTELNVNNYSNHANHEIGVSVTDKAGFTTTKTVTVYFDY